MDVVQQGRRQERVPLDARRLAAALRICIYKKNTCTCMYVLCPQHVTAHVTSPSVSSSLRLLTSSLCGLNSSPSPLLPPISLPRRLSARPSPISLSSFIPDIHNHIDTRPRCLAASHHRRPAPSPCSHLASPRLARHTAACHLVVAPHPLPPISQSSATASPASHQRGTASTAGAAVLPPASSRPIAPLTRSPACRIISSPPRPAEAPLAPPSSLAGAPSTSTSTTSLLSPAHRLLAVVGKARPLAPPHRMPLR